MLTHHSSEEQKSQEEQAPLESAVALWLSGKVTLANPPVKPQHSPESEADTLRWEATAGLARADMYRTGA